MLKKITIALLFLTFSIVLYVMLSNKENKNIPEGADNIINHEEADTFNGIKYYECNVSYKDFKDFMKKNGYPYKKVSFHAITGYSLKHPE